VLAALRTLPSHGWTAGWTGRRDRALLVLSQLAGLSYESIAELTIGDVQIVDGTATIRTPGGTTRLEKDDDDLICGPCALARWIHALDLAAIYPDTRVVAAVIARAVPLKADSPHLCQGTVTVAEATRQKALLPNTDQWGPILVAGTAPARIRPIHQVVGRTSTTRAGASRPVGKGGGEIPTQRGVSALPSAHSEIFAHRSSYPVDEHGVTHSEHLAHGLEGRCQQLLDHRWSQSPARRAHQALESDYWTTSSVNDSTFAARSATVPGSTPDDGHGPRQRATFH
jgi:hypothetical protein